MACLCLALALLAPSRAWPPSAHAEDAALGVQTPEALLRLGTALMGGRGPRDQADAIAVFQQLLRLRPESAPAHLALARLQAARAPTEALRHLDWLRAHQGDDDSMWFLRGRALEQLGRLPEAAAAYRQAIYLNPRLLEANTRLHKVLREQQAHQSRVEQASQRFWANPNLASLTLYAQLLMEEAPPQEALRALQDVRQRLPHLREADLWIAQVQGTLGSPIGEVLAYTDYLDYNPGASTVRLLLADRLLQSHSYRSAVDVLRPLQAAPQAIANLEPRDQGRLALLQARLGELDQNWTLLAQSLLRAAQVGVDPARIGSLFRSEVTLYSDQPALWRAEARWLAQRGQYAQAAQARLQAALLDPSDGDAAATLEGLAAPNQAGAAAWLALAKLYLARHQPQPALEALGHISQPDSLQGEPLLQRALAELALSHDQASQQALEAYLSRPVGPVEALYAKGEAAWALGSPEQAVAAWMGNPEVLAAHPELYPRLAGFAQEHGDPAAELAAREQWARLDSLQPRNHRRLGDLYQSSGRTADAIAQWQAALEQQPLDNELVLRLARVELAQGHFRQGRRYLLRGEELQDLPPDLSLVLALDLRTAHRNQEALALVWRVVQAQPENAQARQALPELAATVTSQPAVQRAAIRVAMESGRPDLARQLLERLLQQRPHDEDARAQLVRLYLDESARDLARAQYDLLREGDPARAAPFAREFQ